MDSAKTNLPLVSIITPFLNAERFLEECIESVLAQTYSHWELVLIDDGSTDGSTSIAKGYAARFPGKIIYCDHDQHQNLGASASRNLGTSISNGPFIAFLDSDDIYFPEKLAVQVPLLLAHPEVGMLYASTEYWYSWSGQPYQGKKDRVWTNFRVTPNTVVPPPGLLVVFLTHTDTFPCMGSVLARRTAIDSIGGWENTFTHIYTDQVFHSKMCLNWPVLVCSGHWDRYRQHQDSSCQVVAKSNKQLAAKHRYLKWLEQYLNEQGAGQNREIRQAFEKAVWPFRHPKLDYLKSVPYRFVNKIRRGFRKLYGPARIPEDILTGN